jgi:hypothetical protein
MNIEGKCLPVSRPERKPDWGINKQAMAVIFRYWKLALVEYCRRNVIL